MEEIGNCVQKDNPYLMVVKKSQIVDISVTPEDESNRGHITPIVDLKYGRSLDYDEKEQKIYWVETDSKDDDNGTLYMANVGGGDKVNFFAFPP